MYWDSCYFFDCAMSEYATMVTLFRDIQDINVKPQRQSLDIEFKCGCNEIERAHAQRQASPVR